MTQVISVKKSWWQVIMSPITLVIAKILNIDKAT